MGTLQPGFQFTGSVGNISAYKMRGSDKIIIRTKGGPTKAQIKKGDNFERTRENNAEMGGRSRAAKWVRHSMGRVTKLTDQHLGNALQPLMKAIQLMDDTSARGRRNICFSKAADILPGFSVNKRFPVEQLIPAAIHFETDATNRSASIRVPVLMPGVNLFLPSYAPLFGLVACLAVLPDVVFTERGYMPADFNTWGVTADTPWFVTADGCGAQEITLQLPPIAGVTTGRSLLLSLGIRLGKPGAGGVVQQHRYAGAGKILATVPL